MIHEYKRKLSNRLLTPIQHFMRQEKSSGIVLATAVVLALVLSNSPLRESYFHFFEQHFGFLLNGESYFNFSLEHWINDGLMSFFFFVVGLELKREFISGELRQVRKVIMPVGAAVFGMVVPSLIFLAFNAGTPTASGWGIPMATDIAFALAVVYMLGDRVPLSAKVFLTTLAIVDDLGSVLVIALFYTSQISVANLAIGVAFLLLLFVAGKLGVRNVWFYAIVTVAGVWSSFLMSGIHATIAAVLAAFMVPATPAVTESSFLDRLRRLISDFEGAERNQFPTLEREQVEIVSEVKNTATAAVPPLQRFEHSLHPVVSFVIMPIFALANAGVAFVDMDPSVVTANGVALGVMAGLLIGKPAGILLSVWIMKSLRIGSLSPEMNWRRVAGLGFLASIGFTMSMFVTTLAFTSPECHVQAKVGIFAASLLGMAIGYALLKGGKPAEQMTADEEGLG
ncbi:MAG: Na+/H+ antiporter NhaA [Marinilabiliaceae bacterium]